MAKKTRKKKLTEAQVGSMYHMWRDAHHVHLLRMNMEGQMFKAEAAVMLDDYVPIEVIKRDMARKLVDAVVAADLVKIDVKDRVDPYNKHKVMCGSLTVMVPRR